MHHLAHGVQGSEGFSKSRRLFQAEVVADDRCVGFAFLRASELFFWYPRKGDRRALSVVDLGSRGQVEKNGRR